MASRAKTGELARCFKLLKRTCINFILGPYIVFSSHRLSAPTHAHLTVGAELRRKESCICIVMTTSDDFSKSRAYLVVWGTCKYATVSLSCLLVQVKVSLTVLTLPYVANISPGNVPNRSRGGVASTIIVIAWKSFVVAHQFHTCRVHTEQNNCRSRTAARVMDERQSVE